MLFNKIYDKINHSILSVQNQKQMIRDVGKIELCELLETEPKTQCKVCLSYWEHWHRLLHVRALLWRKGRGEIQKFIKYTMDLLSIPDYIIKKGRPHGHRYGKKLGDREYCNGPTSRRKCKKKFFQGIQWDALADEDHTHHLTAQECYHYNSNWWLRSNQDRFQYCASGAQT